MAERRMFAKTIIDSDHFLDMPQSTQLLYFHLSMRADDDGFINNPKKIQRMVGCSDDDLKLLLAKQYLIPFEPGIVVIKHWKIHNYIRSDRYNPTQYQEEAKMLTKSKTGEYLLMDTTGIPTGRQLVDDLDTQVRLGKDSIGKVNNKRFVKPTVDQIRDYINQQGYAVDAEQFFDYYESKGWVIGKGGPMKDWKASVRTWNRNNYGTATKKVQQTQSLAQQNMAETREDAFRRELEVQYAQEVLVPSMDGVVEYMEFEEWLNARIKD